MRRHLAEAIGTFGFSFLVCGATLFGVHDLGTAELALGIGLAAAAMTVALSSARAVHFNPILTLAAWAAGRVRGRDLPSLWLAQLAGGGVGTALAIVAAMNRPGGSVELASSAAAGFGRASPSGSSFLAVFVVTTTLGGLLSLATLGGSTLAAPARALTAGLAYGATAFVGLPVSGSIPNPATVLGPAVFLGGAALEQVWVFFVAPALGALVAGALRHERPQQSSVTSSASASSPR